MRLRFVAKVLAFLIAAVVAFDGAGAQEKADVKTMAAIKTTIQPVYPEEARKQGIEGMVLVNVLVDASGEVVQAKIERSDAPVLDKAALDAIRRWKFTPAVSKEDEPVAVWMTIPVKFKLSEKEGKAHDK